MRVVAVLVLIGGGMLLAGCAAASIAGAVVDTGVGVAATAVDVTADVAGATARTVTGSGSSDKDKDGKD